MFVKVHGTLVLCYLGYQQLYYSLLKKPSRLSLSLLFFSHDFQEILLKLGTGKHCNYISLFHSYLFVVVFFFFCFLVVVVVSMLLMICRLLLILLLLCLFFQLFYVYIVDAHNYYSYSCFMCYLMLITCCYTHLFLFYFKVVVFFFLNSISFPLFECYDDLFIFSSISLMVAVELLLLMLFR